MGGCNTPGLLLGLEEGQERLCVVMVVVGGAVYKS